MMQEFRIYEQLEDITEHYVTHQLTFCGQTDEHKRMESK